VGKVYIDGKEVVSQAANGKVFKGADPVYVLTKNKPGSDWYKNNSGSIANPAGSTFHSGTDVATAESALTNGQHGPKTSIGGVVTFVRDGPAVFLGEWGKQVWIEGHKTVRHLTEIGTTAIYAYLPAVKNIAKNVKAISDMMDGDLAAEMGDELSAETLEAVKELFTMDTLKGLAGDAALAGLTAVLAAATPVTLGGSAAGAAVTGTATAARVGQRVYSAGQTAAGAYGELSEVLGQLAKPDLSRAEQRELAKRAARLLGQLPKIVAALLAKRNLSKPAQVKKENAPEKVKTTEKPENKPTQCPCNSKKPVVIATGEKSLNQTDFSLAGPLPLTWIRQYRSGDARADGWFGQGWSHPLATELWLQADQLLYLDPQGRHVKLPLLNLGDEHFDAYEQFTISRPEQHQWHLKHSNGQVHRFVRYAHGQWRLQLVDITDRNQNRIELHYAPSNFGDTFDPFAAQARPSHLIDSAGRRLELGWTAHGQLSTVHALVVRDGTQGTLLAHYHYAADPLDPQNQWAPPNLVAHTNPFNQTRRFEWNQHLLVGYTLASGHRHRNTYDHLSPSGRVTLSESVDDGMGLRFAYEPNRTWIKDALGRLTAFAFDERKDIIAVRDALGHISQTPFDANGHPQGSVDALGRRSSTVFDRRGNLTQVIDAAGNTTRIEYNELDLPIKVTNALNQLWTVEYDVRGNRTRSTSPLGTSTHYHIGPRGLPTQITDALGKTKQLQWDEAGQLLVYTDCSGRTTRFAYNALGHLHTTTNALGQTTVNQYDTLGRLQKVTEPGTQGKSGATHRYEWDGEGRLLAYTDPLGQSTRYQYNSNGDPIQRVDAHGKALHYHYDAAGRLVALVNENGARYEFRYDLVDNLTDEVGFDGRHQRYCYNAAGELTHVIETGGSDIGPGKVTHLERDVLGRLVAKRFEGGVTAKDTTPDTTYTYDPLGRLTAAVNPSAHLRFAYDALGQIVSETQILGQGQDALQRQLAHQYDALGNRLQTLLPDGRSLNWLFYGSGHLHQINLAEPAIAGQEPARQTLADMERDALHREISRSQGQLKSQFDYDPAGRLVRHRASVQGATARGLAQQRSAVLERAYAYDAVGQLIARTDSLRGRQDFKYDPVGRILSALPSALPGALPGNSISHTQELFAFDPAGNLLPHPSSDPARDGIIADNRLRIYQDLAFEYDEHGNVTRRIKGNQGAGTHSLADLTWNDDHQLTQATVTRHGVTQTTRYAYDALGRRVIKTDLFGSTHYLWDGDLMVHSQRGSKEALFIFEPHSFVPLATVQGIHKDKESQQTYWYQCDQIGAPQELTDEQGNIVWAADYKVWGEAKLRAIDWPKTGTDGGPARGSNAWHTGASGASSASNRSASPPIDQPFRFQGQQFDGETGLHYNRFRYYDPAIGRFVSQDPIGLEGGDNNYEYAPNPYSWIDAFGLDKKSSKGKNKSDQKSKDDSKNCGVPVRVRHYTSVSRAKAIMASGQVTPGERYRVYLEMASNKPLPPQQVADKYRIPRDRGKAYVETMVCSRRIEVLKNPLYGLDEVTVKGPIQLVEPSIVIQP